MENQFTSTKKICNLQTNEVNKNTKEHRTQRGRRDLDRPLSRNSPRSKRRRRQPKPMRRRRIELGLQKLERSHASTLFCERRMEEIHQ